jgi:hypothetical protein
MLTCYHAYMRVIVWNSQAAAATCGRWTRVSRRYGPQGTLTTWHETRQAEIPARIDVPLAALPSSGAARSRRYSLLHRYRTHSRWRERGPVPTCRPSAGAGPAEPGGSMGCRCDRRAAQSDRATVSVRAQPGDAERQHHRRGCRRPIPSWKSCADHHPQPVGYPAAMTDGHTASELAPRGTAAAEIARLMGRHQSMYACNHANNTRNPYPCPRRLSLPPT